MAAGTKTRRTSRRAGSTDSALAARCAISVLVMQIATIVMFTIDYSVPPAAGGLWQGLWAWFHRPSFIPLIGTVLFGPPVTWLAMTIRGPHRRWLIAAWFVFTAIISLLFAHRAWVMLNLTWGHVSGA